MYDEEATMTASGRRVTQTKGEAVTAIVHMLVTDDKLRGRFLEDAPRTLEELGVRIKDPKKLRQVSEDLRSIIKEHVAVYGSLIDPVRPVADVSPGITTAVVTGASTAVATAVVVGIFNWTDDLADPSQPKKYEWDVIDLDFGRVRMLERLRNSEVKIASLEAAQARERSSKERMGHSDRPARSARESNSDEPDV
jgi:hypothetical protein